MSPVKMAKGEFSIGHSKTISEMMENKNNFSDQINKWKVDKND